LNAAAFTRAVLFFSGLIFGVVLLIVVGGEWLGLFETVSERIPFAVGVVIVLIGWYPVLVNVLRAAWNREVISHTLMSVGVVAALVVGQWITAAIVVFFMRVGDYVETFTAERARRAVKDLTALAPQTARVLRNGEEVETPITQVVPGDTVIVRPGEQIPVDGEVLEGQATVNQATITGESMPVEAGPGSNVFAATIAQLGGLRIRTTRVGADTTFGKVIRLVEEAEANRADVQRLADRFSSYFLPVVAAIATLTFVIGRDPLATAAVLVVACSCSFALATPIAMLASIGAGARRGILIKGGKYLELLAKADVLLIDKTGTLTLGRPQITDVVELNGRSRDEILSLAFAAERYSEHPLAEAVRRAGRDGGIPLLEAQSFAATPGMGVEATVNSSRVRVGNRRFVGANGDGAVLEAAGKTLLYVSENDLPIGILAAADTPRPEVPVALQQVRSLGIKEIRLLTGDNQSTAAALAGQLGIDYQAEMLPEDKVAIVKDYQRRGHTVVMVGDGVNDAPALAQADVGIAMGAAGTDIAMEAAHIVLMRDDWALVPDVLHIARRTLRVVKMNFGFTTVYNLLGLSLAAFGFLPPIFAAAAQSIPDLGILANSSRLLRQK
jgi:Cd2+/Zn2+-exporting ATPase/Cu+-exporting ATPase